MPPIRRTLSEYAPAGVYITSRGRRSATVLPPIAIADTPLGVSTAFRTYVS